MTISAPVEHGRASADWLLLREPADAAARATVLLESLVPRLLARSDRMALVVHDLGSGTGSQRRWLSPRLPLPQRWIEHDRDLTLLGACRCELAELTVDHLAGADLLTASALLDVLTEAALDGLAGVTAELRVPLLATLSVTGRVRLSPADPLDGELLHAFNEHQRRAERSSSLMGLAAVAHASARLTAYGAAVRTAPSPWLLGPSDGPLISAWLDGWLGAAMEQQPALRSAAGAYRRRRLGEIASGRLSVVVDHADLLAWWP